MVLLKLRGVGKIKKLLSGGCTSIFSGHRTRHEAGSARKCNWGMRASHPVLLHTLPVYFPQIFPGTHSVLGRLRLSLQSYTIDPRPKPNNWVRWDLNPCPLRQRITVGVPPLLVVLSSPIKTYTITPVLHLMETHKTRSTSFLLVRSGRR